MVVSGHELPAEYHAVYGDDVCPCNIVALRDAAQWGTQRDPDAWQDAIDTSIITVGVANRQHELVGVGFLAGSSRAAILCDLVVSPKHQRCGIGTFIVAGIVAYADSRGIPYVYVDQEPGNKLHRIYQRLGFMSTPNVYIRDTRHGPNAHE